MNKSLYLRNKMRTLKILYEKKKKRTEKCFYSIINKDIYKRLH